MLSIQNLTYRIGGRTLLEEASLSLDRGERVGIVGPNGTGKSTLLKLISGDLQPDGGSIDIASNVRVGIVRQEAPSGATTPLEAVLASDQRRTDLLRRAEDPMTPPIELADIHEQLNLMEASSAPAKAARILAGLGFNEEAQGQALESFSGGWRMRIALAGLLFVQPELLLLDEPSNHLDVEATLWLQNYLTYYPHGFLLVSHDRELLNSTVTRIAHLERGKFTLYGGNYDQFEQLRAEQARYLEAAAAKQEAARKHMQAFVDRFRYKKTKARQAQSRLKAIQKMTPIELLPDLQSARFELPDPGEAPPPLLYMDQASVGYEAGKPILRKLDIRIDPGDRIALLGANGNGKSTLIKLLAGKLQLFAGHFHRTPKLRVGYFAQDQGEELDLDATPLISVGRWRPRWSEQQGRAHLGRFGLGQEKVKTKIGALSGGEKAKLLLAQVTLDQPHLLLLDEPTNHLDMASRRALIDALMDFPGAVILVSHDSHLLEHVADEFWLVKDGTCQRFDGDMDNYRQLILGQESGKNTRARDAKGFEEEQQPKGDNKKTNSKRPPGQSKKLADSIEKEIAQLTDKIKQIEDVLSNPNIHRQKDVQQKIKELSRILLQMKDTLRQKEEYWLELAGEVERS